MKKLLLNKYNRNLEAKYSTTSFITKNNNKYLIKKSFLFK